MAGKITELPAGAALNGGELIEAVQSGVSVKLPLMGYKVYTALLTQSGTSAPVATVLQNTLGTAVTYSRQGVGAYAFAFGVNPNFAKCTLHFSAGSTDEGVETTISERSTMQDGTLGRFIVCHGTENPADNYLVNTLIEIRIYP